MKRMVFISDLHAGSKVALSYLHKENDIQKKLFYYYEKMMDSFWNKPDILVVNGDAIDGLNYKEQGLGIWSTDLLEQIDDAQELINMWDAKKIFIIRGSDYHVKSGIHCEELLARNMKTEKYNKDDKNMSTDWHLYLTIEQVTFHIAHHVGFSSVFHYKSTPLAREMLYAKLNDMLRHDMEKYKTRAVIRGHAHTFIALEFSTSLGMELPGWKALDPYAKKKGAINLSPDIGIVGFKVQDDNYTWEKNLVRLTDIQKPPHIIIK